MDETAPPSAVNLARRIKRRGWAPSWDWFAACAPGLEEFCAAELSGLELETGPPESGGVPFRGRLAAGYRANLWLRCGGRVLLRLADFRVRTWQDLVRQAGRIPWEVFLPPGRELRIQVSLHSSNLRHRGRVAQVVLEQAVRRMQSLGLEPPRAAGARPGRSQLVLVRGLGRRAMISLDSSGEHLHRRGYRLVPGTAPLREDLAAALLYLCRYQGRQTLLDPMTGSGTLAVEAALMARRLPPALERPLALESWPCHREATWAHLRASARQGVRQRAPAPILARDLRPRSLEQARQNADRAAVAGDIDFEPADFLVGPPPATEPGLVVINPPYGRRLLSPGRAVRLLKEIARKLRLDYRGWRVGLVLQRPAWQGLFNLKGSRRLVVVHGGLKLTLLAGGPG